MVQAFPLVTTSTTSTMDNPSLYRLMTWLSPGYPIGAFSYSHGLEWLVENRDIRDAHSLAAWIDAILTLGTGRNDAIFFAQSHRAAISGESGALTQFAEHAAAFAASAERSLETNAQGKAFCAITNNTWGSPTLDSLVAQTSFPIPYPVAVGIAAADHGIALEAALEAFVHGFAANLVSAGVRLIPLGHTDGQRVLMQLEPAVHQTVHEGLTGDLSRISSIAIMADIAAMKHETQETRLFRS